MGTLAFKRSMQYLVAAMASARRGEDTAMMMLDSVTGTDLKELVMNVSKHRRGGLLFR